MSKNHDATTWGSRQALAICFPNEVNISELGYRRLCKILKRIDDGELTHADAVEEVLKGARILAMQDRITP